MVSSGKTRNVVRKIVPGHPTFRMIRLLLSYDPISGNYPRQGLFWFPITILHPLLKCRLITVVRVVQNPPFVQHSRLPIVIMRNLSETLLPTLADGQRQGKLHMRYHQFDKQNRYLAGWCLIRGCTYRGALT